MIHLNLSSIEVNHSQSIKQIQTPTESIKVEKSQVQVTDAVVYESSSQEPKGLYKADMDKVLAMKEETEQRMIDLFRSTVKGGTLKQIGGIRGYIAKLRGIDPKELGSVDPKAPVPQETTDFEIEITDEAVQKAQTDVAEGGYWSAEAVSDRFLEFAVALSGDNPEKADMLLDAVKAGYEAAEEIWGDTLPQLSQDTLALTIEKFEAWRDGE